jgi:hypothetical protein
VRACETDAGQTWVIVVGNENMYGSFSNFQNLISQSQYEETWTVDVNGDSTYSASIQFDTIAIDYQWGPLLSTGIEEVTENGSFQMWPNPATENVILGLDEFEGKAEITVVNSLGQTIFSQTVSSAQKQSMLPTSNWSSGLYSVTVRDDEKLLTQRLVKQ